MIEEVIEGFAYGYDIGKKAWKKGGPRLYFRCLAILYLGAIAEIAQNALEALAEGEE